MRACASVLREAGRGIWENNLLTKVVYGGRDRLPYLEQVHVHSRGAFVPASTLEGEGVVLTSTVIRSRSMLGLTNLDIPLQDICASPCKPARRFQLNAQHCQFIGHREVGVGEERAQHVDYSFIRARDRRSSQPGVL